ncbi:hypothetical protein [Streptomyces sp. NPDC088258]|uniref:hypothetical protein n=1 Tax=Streptomyces sp. NPDC088258 TaxID=3365849 RepID=UPI0037F653C3
MTTLLEARYRAVLRLLPAYYRREREEEMIETYLCDMDQDTQDQSRPTLGEVVSVAALALRCRLGAAGAPGPYVLLGSTVRLFALFAVLLQAADALKGRALELTWAFGGDGTGRRLFLSTFTDHGLLSATVAAFEWILPLLWVVAYFALLRDRRRLARAAALSAALPTLWPFVGPLVMSTMTPADSLYPFACAALAWVPALTLCAAHHRDAPPARLPVGTPGLALMTCCVVMGASIVLLPAVADAAWAPVTCFLVGALGWLLWRGRRGAPGSSGGSLALAVLGGLLLLVRVADTYPWLGGAAPGELIGGGLGQTAALTVLIAVLAVVGRRDAAAR